MFEVLIAMNYKGFVDLEYEIHPDDPMQQLCLHARRLGGPGACEPKPDAFGALSPITTCPNETVAVSSKGVAPVTTTVSMLFPT
jgi:hypothetical protein